MANQNASRKHQKRKSEIVSTPVDVTLHHPDVRKLLTSQRAFMITYAYWAVETWILDRVKEEDKVQEAIEKYNRRGKEILKDIMDEEDRLEQIAEEHALYSTLEVSDMDQAIKKATKAINQDEDPTKTYNRSTHGQNLYLDILRHLDRVYMMLEILPQNGLVDPVTRKRTRKSLFKKVDRLGSIVIGSEVKGREMYKQQREREREEKEAKRAKAAQKKKNKKAAEKAEDGEQATTAQGDSQEKAGDGEQATTAQGDSQEKAAAATMETENKSETPSAGNGKANKANGASADDDAKKAVSAAETKTASTTTRKSTSSSKQATTASGT